MEKPSMSDTLRRIRCRIEEAALQAGRDPQQVRLMAVTKTVPPQRVNEAIACGIDLLGENRVQEYLEKRPLYAAEHCQVHMIGALQTNKVKYIIDKVEMIQSLDSLRLAAAIDRCASAAGRRMPVLVEVNIGREESKSGVFAEQLPEFLCQLAEYPALQVQGLMAIPPATADSRQTEAYFSEMFRLFIDMREKNIDNIGMSVLSMGMSADYPLAVKHGSTMVRLGSCMFGSRQ